MASGQVWGDISASRGFNDQRIHLPGTITWKTVPGWSCRNPEKTEKSVKVCRCPSSWEQAHLHLTHGQYVPPTPQCPRLAGPLAPPLWADLEEKHTLSLPILLIPFLCLTPSSLPFPLGGSHLDYPDSHLQIHQKQHLDPRVQGCLPLTASLLSSRPPLNTPERRGNGVKAQGYGTSLGAQHSAGP